MVPAWVVAWADGWEPGVEAPVTRGLEWQPQDEEESSYIL